MRSEILKQNGGVIEGYSAPEKTHEVEAILAMRRDELKPDVLEYADNLHAQILNLSQKYGAKNAEEFLELAKNPKKVPLEKILEFKRLVDQLNEVLEKGEIKEYILEGLRFIEQAKNTADKIEDANERAKAYASIGLAEAKVGQDPGASFDCAMGIATETREMKDGYSGNVYMNIAITEAEAGRFDLAHKTVLEMKHDIDRSSAYGGIVKAYADVGRFDEAKDMAKEIKDPFPQADAYIAIAAAEAELGHFEDAKFTLKKTNVNLARGWRIIATIEARAGLDPTESFNQAKAHAKGLPESFSGQEYEHIVAAEADSGRFDQADVTAEEISSPFYRARAYAAIGKAETEVDQHPVAHFSHAKEVAKEIENTGQRNHVYSTIAEVQSKWELDMARSTAEEITEGQWRARAYAAIGKAEVETGQNPLSFEQAKITVEELSSEYYQDICFMDIAKAEAAVGRLDQAKVTAEKVKDKRPRSSVYRDIAVHEAMRGVDIIKGGKNK